MIEEGYYRINKTKRILYFDGITWFKPRKDIRGSYSGLLSKLDKQPIIKSFEAVDIDKL